MKFCENPALNNCPEAATVWGGSTDVADNGGAGNDDGNDDGDNDGNGGEGEGNGEASGSAIPVLSSITFLIICCRSLIALFY